MKKEKSELIQEALDTLQAVTLSWRSTESYVAELFENIRNLEEENKKLNIKVASLEWEIKWLNSVIGKLREELSAYDREYFDEDKKAEHIFMEEDTLQELRDLGKI